MLRLDQRVVALGVRWYHQVCLWGQAAPLVETLDLGCDVLREFTKIYLEIFVVVESSQDSIYVAFGYILVVLDHEFVQLIEIDEAVSSQIDHSIARHGVEVRLPL